MFMIMAVVDVLISPAMLLWHIITVKWQRHVHRNDTTTYPWER